MALKGVKQTEEHKKKISIALTGKKQSPEHLEKNRLSHIGLKQSEETKKKRALIVRGEHHGMWKGDKVGKQATHMWIERWAGTPSLCEMCGTTTAKKYEWANIDHSYKRVLEDYIRMCTSCHRKYDIKNNNYRIGYMSNRYVGGRHKK